MTTLTTMIYARFENTEIINDIWIHYIHIVLTHYNPVATDSIFSL